MSKHTLLGEVVRLKNTKTVGVKVERWVMHPLYRKLIRTRKIYQVHDEHAKSRLQDKVEIVECRPISKTKRFRLGKVLSSEDFSVAKEQEAKRAANLRAKRQVWLKEYGAYYAFTFKRVFEEAVAANWTPPTSPADEKQKTQFEATPRRRVSRRSAAAQKTKTEEEKEEVES